MMRPTQSERFSDAPQNIYDWVAVCMRLKKTLPLYEIRVKFNPTTFAAALGLLLLSPLAAQAISLGAIQSQSSLGQALRLVIPVSLHADEVADCVRIRTGSDDLPTPLNTRSMLIQKGQSTQLEISTRQSINDPVLGLTVSIGCDAAVTRSYVLLLDPPQVTELAIASQPVTADAPASQSSKTSPLVIKNTAANSRKSRALARISQRKKNARKIAPKSFQEAGGVSQVQPDLAVAQSAPADVNRKSSGPKQVAAPTESQTDHLLLSNQVPGTALRLSSDLPPTESKIDPAQLKQLQQEQERMAATVNGQDPAELLARREAELAERIKALTAQAASMQQKIDMLTARNQALENSTLPVWLVWLIGVLGLMALTLLAWFVWRYKILQQSLAGQPWWAAGSAESMQEQASGPDQGAGQVRVSKVQSSDKISKPAVVPPVTAADQGRIRATAPAGSSVAGAVPAKSMTARLNTEALTPLGTTTSAASTIATDIGVLPKGAHAIELTDHGNFDATRSSFERLDASQIASQITTQVASPVAPSIPSQPNVPPGSAPQIVEKSPASALLATVPMGLNADTNKSGKSGKPANQDQVDFMLDINSAGHTKPIGNSLDFSLATEVNKPQVDHDLLDATESFFRGIKTEPGPGGGYFGVESEVVAAGQSSVARQADELQSAIQTEPLKPVAGMDQSSLHFRLVEQTSAIEQIEELLKQNDVGPAIELLSGYISHGDHTPTLMWLILLEQYRKAKQKKKYEELAQSFKQRYGRNALQWDETPVRRTAQLSISQLTGLDENIKVLWGTQKGLELIDRLTSGNDQPDAVVFNAVLQRELLQLAPVYPIDKITRI